ncbi:MAG: hydantoinase B/oxoprolinase family protein [Arenicellales bacterium]|nr:hydantoinase B/oxoprolinase family protein [Arenicellales bacterium]
MSTSNQTTTPGWQFWVDRGGTFTDVVAINPQGTVVTHKLLSENPEKYADAPLQGIRDVLNLSSREPIPTHLIEAVKMGTTVGTNALLEHKGEPTALVITKGFKDALRIGYQHRPDIFALHIDLPSMLYSQVVEIDERIDAHGNVVAPLDIAKSSQALKDLRENGFNSIAIVLMHAYRYPEHERMLANLARELGFAQVSVSHEVSSLMKLVSRGDTTVVDAYLSPILGRYVQTIASELSGTKLYFMQSNGGLADAATFRGKDCILSGPAGGVVGAVATATRDGYERIIGFDMGGTSTDVCHFNGEFERTLESEVAGVRIRAPMLRIHTVAAGGGSIVRFDGARFRVGPESAGANPGPACYRRGGPLTVTDCNVMLGKLIPDNFPKVFGDSGDQAIDEVIVQQKFEQLAAEVNKSAQNKSTVHQIAQGFIGVAVQNMAAAIKRISVERGYDVSQYTLCCFGGAGAQHACLVAQALGMRRVLIHKHASLLSAYGIGLADIRVLQEKTIELSLDHAIIAKLDIAFDQLLQQGKRILRQQGIEESRFEALKKTHIRYAGTDTALEVNYGRNPEQLVRHFEELHQNRFGFVDPTREVIVESASIELIVPMKAPGTASREATAKTSGASIAEVFFDGAFHQCGVYQRDALPTESWIIGPAIIIEPNSTIVVEPGWHAQLTKSEQLLLERSTTISKKQSTGAQADPVMLEIFNKLFISVAEQMGHTLQNTSYSVNMKERLDFSCAVFDSQGGLVSNAPHMPVHLGSMGDTVINVIKQRHNDIRPGDAYIHNAPYQGGTHLPDITVISPVFNKTNTELLFYVASRGHHADIGGISPGSMPPSSVNVEQEGVLIDNFLGVRGGKFHEKELVDLLCSGPYPSRNPDQNIADLKAQIAANAKGTEELHGMIGEYGLEIVQNYMQHVQANAEESVRKVIDVLKDGAFTCALDDGSAINVQISIDRSKRTAHIDFSGTSTQQKSNFNAPSAVCRAAVLYVFRTLVADEIPLNSGCLKPLDIVIPKGSMLNPEYPAAVVAGNVETSQVIVDTLYAALGVRAASQGTMNNFAFGNDTYQYYETICGGAGGGNGFPGTDAVHTHMTNSRLTDPEVLEWRFPVRVDEFHIRKGSGGNGQQRGGNGVIRRIRFLQPMTASILSNRRSTEPFGLAGGGSGFTGINQVERADGTVDRLKACGQVEMAPGDVFAIKTPGGGGFGPA